MHWNARSAITKRKISSLLSCGLIAALSMGLTGCDGFFVSQNTNPATSTGVFYVGNGSNAFIAGFSISSSGALSVLSNSPYNNGVAAICLAMTPSNGILYAGTSNGIYAYLVNSDGSLTVQNSGAPVAQDMIASSLQVDSTGTYLLAAGLGSALSSQAIGIYQIDASSGALSALGGSPLALYTGGGSSPVLAVPGQMLITPNNSFVYVSLGTLGVQVLTLGSGGALSTGSSPTILPPSSKSTSPSDSGLASDPSSKFLFVAEINTGLRVLSIGTGGALNEVSGSPYTTGTGPSGVLVDPTGAYVYVANKGSNNISGYALTATSGQLTAIAGSPFASGGQLPIALANNSTKKYVAVINSGSNGSGGNSDVQLFSYSTTTPGALTAGATASTGTDPTAPQALAASYPSQ